METEYIRYLSVPEATVTADNLSDEGRAYNIAARLRIRNGALAAVDAGTVTLKEDSSPLADFGQNADGSMWLSLLPAAAGQGSDILEAAQAFAASAREKVIQSPPLQPQE